MVLGWEMLKKGESERRLKGIATQGDLDEYYRRDDGGKQLMETWKNVNEKMLKGCNLRRLERL